MRTLLLCVALAGLAGCMKASDMAGGVEYHLRDMALLDRSEIRRSASWRLQADSALYIAQSHYRPAGVDPARSNQVAQEAFKAFVEYFPLLQRAGAPMGLDEALASARSAGSHYLLYNRLAASDDRIGSYVEWEEQEALDRLGTDSASIQLMLIEVGTGHMVDTARIRTRGGLLWLYDNQPHEQLQRAFAEYARSLIGVGQRYQ